MKDSPTEPPLKKLKQARLPFQILSPPVVKNVESPPSQCKRKACEATSDDEVVISEINENKIKPVEKKAKTATEDESHKKNESSDVRMEVEKEKNRKKVSEKKRQNKKDSNPNKLTSTPKSSRKSAGKGLNKAKGKKEKTPAVVDFIDLSDSPVKTPSKEKEPKSVSNDEVNISADLSDDKGNQSEDCATSQSDSSVTHAASDDQLQEVGSKSSDENKTNNDKKIESEETKIEESEKDKSIEKSSSTDPVEESAPQSKSTSSNDQTSSIVSSPKQSSIEKLVTSLNSKSNSTPDSLDISKNKSDEECDIKTDEEVQENKSHDSQALDDQQKSPSTKSTDSLKKETNLKTPSTANDSLMSDVSSPSSECNTSSLSTPGSDSIKKISKTPRRMTPKQLLKVKELEEKRKERERMKEEKEKKRAEEREEKLKLKREKEEERLKLKQEKEDEKRKEKEEKEKKRQAELDQKNEEKRLKEEEKRQKEEEKRVKDEEKRKREEEERKKKEEKRLKEEQKEAEKRKSAQAFASFFVKAESKPVCVEEAKENTPLDSNFQPFEVKNDMRLAPLVRTQLLEDRRQLLDSAIESAKVDDSQRLYLELIRSPSYVCGSASRTYPPPDDNEDDVIIIESEMPNEELEVDENKIGKKTEKRRRRAKLLQFHENRRPPYWGTWRKKSKHIRPRAPLNQDKTILEYEVDSDDEWEEPEEGESLRGSDEEEEQDDQYEEDNDMFVPHGYLSDGEGDEDELDDNSPESMKAKLKVLQLEFETERKQKQEKLKPRLIGCIWFCNSETVPSNDSNIAALFLARRAVWEGSLPITVAPSVPSSPSTSVSRVAENTEPKSGVKKKLVNESLIPNIIRKIHGSRKKLSKLLLELMEEWEKDKIEPLPSKNCLVKRIRELAVWEKPPGTGTPCWFVNEEVRAAYGLVDLALPSPPTPTPSMPSPSANITKFTKVLTTDERLKLLRESPASSKEPPKEPPKTPSTPAENLKTPNKTVKTPTVKLATASPVVKKRAHLITIGPKESPKQSATTSMMNFVTKSAKSDETESPKQEKKVEEKVKKRITPITLTSSVHKLVTPVSPSSDDCIVIDD
ncbi:chromatin assembly factor 1 subunit A-B-like [Macrosteles quadrilineatus]|uniref:chromatin assembly factor 1 subunit A-B-like n=1 Tax=Macrosteles quadrilineatus TaxID=74068 RepID=UPI0023E28233|nr:chromatin assembly factor 1 subunit A-B-like [Macrosteles quadrilineatus]XP_054287452.1 chromatin assembly factor 1 subunit A-B-like [Macrosteles quadrilineatus]